MLDRLLRVASDLAALALAGVMLVTIADIAIKNIAGRPIASTFEWVEIGLAAMVFLGFPRVFRNDGNVVVDVIDLIASKRTVGVLTTIGAVATLGFLLLIGYAMIEPATDTVRYPEAKPESGVPLYWIWIPVLVGTALSIVGAALVLRDRLMRRGER